jgi:hypothetical protein
MKQQQLAEGKGETGRHQFTPVAPPEPGREEAVA